MSLYKPVKQPGDTWWSFEDLNGVVKMSYWSLSTYQQCPGKYRFQALQLPGRKFESDKRNAVVGSIEHSIFEDFFLKGDFQPTDFADKVENTLTEFQGKELVVWKDDQDRDRVVSEIENDLQVAYDLFKREGLLSPYTSPEISLEGWLTPQILLRGRIDLYNEPPDDESFVVDHKAVEKETNLDRKQLIFYRLLCRVSGHKVPTRLGWHLTKQNRIKWAKISANDELRLVQEIKSAVEGIKSENFEYQVNRVTCQWCDFRKECPAFKRMFPNQDLFDQVKQIKDSGSVDF